MDSFSGSTDTRIYSSNCPVGSCHDWSRGIIDPGEQSIYTVLAKAFLLCLEAFETRSFLKDPYNRYPPEALAEVINTSLFWWLNTLIQNGHRNLLSLVDLFDTDEALSSSSLETKMQTAWRNQSSNRKYSLLFGILTRTRGIEL
ncbi:hypothetical protein BPOR_0055g00120 [Botrytis porri]|uniref:Uncharacterized protein n=1 Tax=Botrytis porri TaxID=87229 RepID=A0A4Z1L1F7_9HELO|nr:hypothetical protein BPOR_0055g00120 [Botrytis porri]